jgi:hypothetical protein
MKSIRILNILFGALCLAILATPAEAAYQSSLTPSYCPIGTLVGTGSNALTNGSLAFGWCRDTDGDALVVTLKYTKTAGAAVDLRFGYEWTNMYGTVTAGRTWDTSANSTVTANSSETWSYRFLNSPADSQPSGQTPCVRGLMKIDNLLIYATTIACP